jgi:hypothetical protein
MDLATAREVIGSKSKSRMNARGVYSYSLARQKEEVWVVSKAARRKRVGKRIGCTRRRLQAVSE